MIKNKAAGIEPNLWGAFFDQCIAVLRQASRAFLFSFIFYFWRCESCQRQMRGTFLRAGVLNFSLTDFGPVFRLLWRRKAQTGLLCETFQVVRQSQNLVCVLMFLNRWSIKTGWERKKPSVPSTDMKAAWGSARIKQIWTGRGWGWGGGRDPYCKCPGRKVRR